MEISVPLQAVWDYSVDWEINQHASLKLTGEIDPKAKGYLTRLYIGTHIALFMLNNSLKKEETVFKGIISSVQLEYGDGSCKAVIVGTSASKELDCKKESRSFQDISMTYTDIAKEIILGAGGSLICTEGKTTIQKPFIQYQETAWEFVRRLASISHIYVIPDIITGHPGIWLGMRKGKRMLERIEEWESINVKKKYDKIQGSKNLTTYHISSRNLYRIGDYSEKNGQPCVIYKVAANYTQGELLFQYDLARENELETETYFNEKLTGLSIPGTVCNTENENIYLKLNIDGKEGSYPYRWFPETGNALYAMPESGAPAVLYLSGPDEREAISISCIHCEGSEKHKSSDYTKKEIETVFGDKISLYPADIEVSKNESHILNLNDKSGVEISSENKIDLEADGNICLEAQRITILMPGEIKAVVDR